MPASKRDLISLEFSSAEILRLLSLSVQLKKNRNKGAQALRGKTVGLIFQKPSNRTRVSFEVGIHQLGGNCVYLGPEEINLGQRESTADAARTLSRYLDGIVARTFSHQDVVDLARYADIPVINGLSDAFHPCQALADLFSIQEFFGRLKGLTVAYIGDGNNVCNSLLQVCAMTGVNVNVAAPKGYEPSLEILREVQPLALLNKSRVQVTHSPREAVKGAHVLYADVWVSMGQEAETRRRLKIFKDYQINRQLAELADKNFIFMHCLPAHRGQEVTEEIIDGRHSIIFDQAENRLHVQKAVLLCLAGGHKL